MRCMDMDRGTGETTGYQRQIHFNKGSYVYGFCLVGEICYEL